MVATLLERRMLNQKYKNQALARKGDRKKQCKDGHEEQLQPNADEWQNKHDDLNWKKQLANEERLNPTDYDALEKEAEMARRIVEAMTMRDNQAEMARTIVEAMTMCDNQTVATASEGDQQSGASKSQGQQELDDKLAARLQNIQEGVELVLERSEIKQPPSAEQRELHAKLETRMQKNRDGGEMVWESCRETQEVNAQARSSQKRMPYASLVRGSLVRMGSLKIPYTSSVSKREKAVQPLQAVAPPAEAAPPVVVVV